MKERGILFSAPMVRALLDGTKTQTRRAVKGLTDKMWIEDTAEGGFAVCYDSEPNCGTGVWEVAEHSHPIVCPYGVPGDRLWVRETWARTKVFPVSDMVVYREGDNRTDYGGPWKPGIHMFRRDSRILLEITGVRVERLQEISEADAIAEGSFGWAGEQDTPVRDLLEARLVYRQLWEQINGSGSWDANPWVWVVEFAKVNPMPLTVQCHHQGKDGR